MLELKDVYNTIMLSKYSKPFCGYGSKSFHPAANYSTIELELLGLCANISQLNNLPAKVLEVYFDCTVAHLAFTSIMKNEIELASARIKKLLEELIHLTYII